MIKPVTLLLAIIVCLAPLLPAGAEVDLFDIQAALLLGETTVKVPAEAQETDLVAIRDCIKGAEDITLDLSATKIKVISDSPFSSCSALKEVILPSTLTTIGDEAFRGCDSLTSLTIPAGVKSIGLSAFAWCENLALLKIPDSVTSIGDSAFRGCTALADKDGFVIVRDILFDYTGNAQKVVIPDGVTSIGVEAFGGCTSLSSVTIPDGVTSIGGYAFSWCDSLTSLTIPAGVTSIGASAFNRCYSLTLVTFESTGGWYLDEALTQSVGSGELSSRVKAGAALYMRCD